MSQRDVPQLRGDTHIIGDVPGFDSLNAEELTIILSETLTTELSGRELPGRIVLGAGKTARPTIDDIASAVDRYIEKSAKKQKRAA
jgi:acyl carrier protein